MRGWFRTGRGVGLISFVVLALLIFGMAPYVKPNLLSGEGAAQQAAPTASREAQQEKADIGAAAAERAALEADLLIAKAEAAKEAAAAKETLEEPAARRSGEDEVAQRGSGSASASAGALAAPSAVPTDTTMYLTVPKLGLYDIPVLEGTSEAVLSQGVGHVPGTGYPWAAGSNTYIAGHRLGYPGTVSDHVFWNLPSLAIGDQIIVEDSLGQTYTYQVSEILEVYPTDLSVTWATGADVVSLQTCIENFGDYWTPGPNWFARYVVRGERVS